MEKKDSDNKKPALNAETEILLEESEDSPAKKEAAEVVRHLKEKIKESDARAAEYLDSLQRLKADYINRRKDDDRRTEEIIRFANEKLLLDLLPLADSFVLAFSNKESWESAPEDWRRGVESIYGQLVSIFDRYQLKEINPVGQLFNPAFHHSVASLETDEEKDNNKVIEVLQRGYELNGKLIRPAVVKIAEHHRS
jgi:molecular chaperone GrpE